MRTLKLEATLLVAALTFAGAASGCHETNHGHDHDGAASAAVPAGLNPVQHEMRLLHEAMRDAVTAVANGEVSTIPQSLHRVHGAKEATSAAIKGGSYKPPKNANKMDEFVQLDEAFHDDLRAIIGAAKKNDVSATGRAIGQALASCQGCHEQYRF